MNNIDDKEIVRRIREGDTGSFAVLVERHGSKVFSLAVRITGNREDAEELTQDVFMKALGNLDSYRGDSAFATWLYRIAYNSAVSRTRRKKREIPVGDEQAFRAGAGPDEGYDMERERRLGQIEGALARLPGRERILIEMYYYQDKSVEELACITGMSVSNVKVKLFRIRKKIFDDIAS